MDAKTKRRCEIDSQIESRKADIIAAAIDEFVRCGIDNAKLSDIAKRAEVGAATVYRYFENKTGLVIECATKLWNGETQTIFPTLSPEKMAGKNGFEQVREVLNLIGSLYTKCPEVLRLMEEFDNYIVREKVSKEQLSLYEQGILGTEDFLVAAVLKGKKDGSIKQSVDSKLFYATATHAITSLSQKLLLRGNILSSDSEVSPKDQINSLIQMELLYIKN